MIAILKYNAGNIRSVFNALIRLGYESVITDDTKVLLNAEKVIIPGVGEAGSAMDYLRSRKLDKLLVSLKQPVLGICLGQHLMCRFSEEGDTECMGVFNSIVRKFPPDDKVPHMGWNNFTGLRSELFKGITITDDVYFVHSYYSEISEHSIAECDYITPFSAAMKKNNFYSTQFHPEKSADIGIRILQNFLEL
jgi:glutamine amidotransferase